MFTPSPHSKTLPETPVSLYKPLPEESDEEPPRDRLNYFLASRDVSPIRYELKTPWLQCTERTRRYHTRKANQVIGAALEEIAPNDTEELLKSVAAQQSKQNESNEDTVLLNLIAESYANADHWSTQRQVLSIVADQVSFPTIQKWIPGVKRHKFGEKT